MKSEIRNQRTSCRLPAGVPPAATATPRSLTESLWLPAAFGFRISDFLRTSGFGLRIWRLAAVILLLALSATAATQAEAQRTEQLYVTARTNYLAAPTDADAALRFGQACFNRAEFATNSTQRAALAEEGIAASRRVIAQAPTNGAAFYVLGLNLGQLARTRTLGALKLVSQMEKAFLQAIALDAKFDYAGPHRLLGLLYQKAPGWPASIGSKKKARVHLQKAAEVAPDYADNWLCLLEACLEWDDQAAVRKWLPQAEASMQAAKTKFTGAEWDWTRQDWEDRWRKIKP